LEAGSLLMVRRIWTALLTLLLVYIVLDLVTAALERYLGLIIIGLFIIALVYIIRRWGKGL
jgi:hypothetical protein